MRDMLDHLKAVAAANPDAIIHLQNLIAEHEATLANLEAYQTAFDRADYTIAQTIADKAFPIPDLYEGYPEDAIALEEAVSEGDLTEIRRLLPLVPLNQGYGNYAMPPLRAALRAENNRLEIVRMFLDAGADAAFATDEGYTALHWISDSGYCADNVQFEIAALLVELGGQIEAENHYGWTPLMGAVMEGDAHEVAALLAVGADPNRIYGDFSMPYFSRGKLPLMVAATKHDILQLLLDHGAEVQARAANGRTAVECLRDEAAAMAIKLAKDVAAGEDEAWDHTYARDLQRGFEIVDAWSKRPKS